MYFDDEERKSTNSSLLFLFSSFSIILERKAARLRKETGDDSYVSYDEDENQTMTQLLKVSLARPFVFLFTEPITMFAALW